MLLYRTMEPHRSISVVNIDPKCRWGMVVRHALLMKTSINGFGEA